MRRRLPLPQQAIQHLLKIICRHLLSPLPAPLLKHKTLPPFGLATDGSRVRQIASRRKTLRATRCSARSRRTSGTSSTRRARASTQSPYPRFPEAARTRNSAFFPGCPFGTSRTSRQPGLKTESGRRRLVFSFFIRQRALGFDGIHDLARKIFRRQFERRRRSCLLTIELKPRNLTHAPLDVDPVDLG